MEKDLSDEELNAKIKMIRIEVDAYQKLHDGFSALASIQSDHVFTSYVFQAEHYEKLQLECAVILDQLQTKGMRS
jgi:hypothetical protein